MSKISIESTLVEKSPSRKEKWWGETGFSEIYKAFHGGKVDEKIKNMDVRDVSKIFNLRGYQFGNWVTNEDRYNYLMALIICLYDLNKVLKFRANNLGLDGHLGISFGARGFKGAIAHFEPYSNVINITRYEDGDGAKEYRFITTGGVGSFAHEYGHFLDYFFGSRVETDGNVYSLTSGNSLQRKRIPYGSNQPMRNVVEDILEIAYWDKKKKEPSPFIKRIKNYSEREYYVQRNEIFARLFEQYIGFKLKEMGVNNRFLTEEKYFTSVYMTNSELKEVVPLFDKLIGLMQKAF